MKMTQTKQPEKQTLRYKFVLLFALSSLLPVLLFLFLLNQYGLVEEPRVVLMLGMATLVAILGFFFFLRVVKQLAGLAQDFVRVEHGELEGLEIREGAAELSEMARIADAFNRTLKELKEHTRELENLVSKLSTLSELTELVSRIPDIKEVLQIILQRTMVAVNAKIGSIMILDDKTQALRIAAAEGLDQSVISDTTVPLGEGVAGKVAQTGKPVLVEDVEQDSRFHKINDPKYETSSFISMPLRAHLRILGVLNLSKKGDQKTFTESDMKFLTTLLGHIGFALENAKLLQEAKESAIRLKEALEQQSQRLDQAHQQIIRSDKLSALGQLIAGVAHELNNPLTTIIGRAEIMLGEVKGGKALRDLEQISRQGQRAAKIVQNLLSFARQTVPEKQLCDINQILQGVLEMLDYDFRVSNIEVKTELDRDLPHTMVDANQIQQVFVNIVNNAYQAMKEQEVPGRFTVRTGRHDGQLTVEFTDTGPGMGAEQQEHVFEPFFTTKSESKGTGLGLSISYGIVKAHRGGIDVRSSVGEGTTFIVELPVISGPSSASIEQTDEVRQTKLNIPKVLVVDDEETISEVITEILKKEGCHVDAVTTGELALQKMKEEMYDLVLCDIRMPGVDGREVYSQVERDIPQLARRFLFLTGDISEQTRAFLQETDKPYLMKPFTREAFLEELSKHAYKSRELRTGPQPSVTIPT
jgi:signal transduction histidine kinase/ActR/RegA family two-component response regulator